MLQLQFSIRLFSVLLLSSSLYFPAQLGNLWQKAKEKTEKAVDQAITKKSRPRPAEAQSTEPFTPGDLPLFSEDFSGYPAGATASSVRSNGLAAVAAVPGYPGKWLILEDKALYKLSKPVSYPVHFTVAFDLLATGDQINDIAPLSFGFAPDNSTKEYLSTSGAYVELQYYDTDMVNTGSKDPEKYANHTFDLAPYLNRILPVRLEVKGEQMAVYLGSRKIADGLFFRPAAARNFYISAPWQYVNGAKVYFGNLRITGFSK